MPGPMVRRPVARRRFRHPATCFPVVIWPGEAQIIAAADGVREGLQLALADDLREVRRSAIADAGRP